MQRDSHFAAGWLGTYSATERLRKRYRRKIRYELSIQEGENIRRESCLMKMWGFWGAELRCASKHRVDISIEAYGHAKGDSALNVSGSRRISTVQNRVKGSSNSELARWDGYRWILISDGDNDSRNVICLAMSCKVWPTLAWPSPRTFPQSLPRILPRLLPRRATATFLNSWLGVASLIEKFSSKQSYCLLPKSDTP